MASSFSIISPTTKDRLTDVLIQSVATLSRRYQKPVVFCLLPGKREQLTFDDRRILSHLRGRGCGLECPVLFLRHFEGLR